jgi:hypothetical protein
MAKNSKSILRRLLLLTQPFNKPKIALQLEMLDMLIDEIVRKNKVVVTELQERISQLDVVNFPNRISTSTSISTNTCDNNCICTGNSMSASAYRSERLIKDLDAMNVKLQLLKRILYVRHVLGALSLFMFDLYPLALKISCRHQIETGAPGDFIEDTSALYLLCEQYAEAVREEGNVSKSDEFAPTQDRGENTMRALEVNGPSDEDQIYDSSNGKRAS